MFMISGACRESERAIGWAVHSERRNINRIYSFRTDLGSTQVDSFVIADYAQTKKGTNLFFLCGIENNSVPFFHWINEKTQTSVYRNIQLLSSVVDCPSKSEP